MSAARTAGVKIIPVRSGQIIDCDEPTRVKVEWVVGLDESGVPVGEMVAIVPQGRE